jgi:hypothetical protein
MRRGSLPALALALLGMACVDEPPPPGTSIGAFSFTAEYDAGDAAVADPLAGSQIACVTDPKATLPRCNFAVADQARDPLRFDAVLSYEPTASGDETFYLQPGTDTTRDGVLAGTHFWTLAPKPTGCSNVGVPRQIPSCDTCRVTALEWISGDLLERVPDEGCQAITAAGGDTLDPAAVGAVCGMLVVRVTLADRVEGTPCTCSQEPPPDLAEPLMSCEESPVTGCCPGTVVEDRCDVPVPAECAIVYTLTGTRS